MSVGGSVRRRRFRLVRRLGSPGLSALELLAPGAVWQDQLRLVACAAEAEAADCHCSIHRIHPQTQQMLDGFGPSLPPGYMERFVRCGAVWYREPVVVPDVRIEHAWERCRTPMEEYGYTGFLAAPILGSSGQHLGEVLLHTRSVRIPDPGTERALALGALLAAVLLEREIWRAAWSGREGSLPGLAAAAASGRDGARPDRGGVLAVDREGRILSFGSTALELLGGPELVPGQLLEASELPPELRVALWQVLRWSRPEVRAEWSGAGLEALAGGADPGLRSRILFRVGHRDVEATISPLVTARGRCYGAMAVLAEATEQVRYRQLQESLVANVSHEIRTPLAALSAAVEALHDGLIPAERQTQFLRGILGEIGRMRRLSTQLLEISRLETGALPVSAEEVRLAPILESVAMVWEARCQGVGLELEMAAPDLTVIADPDRVEEVLINLLENAIRHTPPGGRVRISAIKAGDQALVAVSDTGVGIEPEHLPYIWDRFYMTDESRCRSEHRGSGLGLSIVRLLVEQMGGRVLVDSLPGIGSTFSFTLPLG